MYNAKWKVIAREIMSEAIKYAIGLGIVFGGLAFTEIVLQNILHYTYASGIGFVITWLSISLWATWMGNNWLVRHPLRKKKWGEDNAT